MKFQLVEDFDEELESSLNKNFNDFVNSNPKEGTKYGNFIVHYLGEELSLMPQNYYNENIRKTSHKKTNQNFDLDEAFANINMNNVYSNFTPDTTFIQPMNMNNNIMENMQNPQQIQEVSLSDSVDFAVDDDF